MAHVHGDDRHVHPWAARWERSWFAPAAARPLAIVRILTGLVALAAWWSWWPDIVTWFGPDGLLPADVVRRWRSPWAVSFYDLATSAAAVRGCHLAVGAVLALLTCGVATAVTAPLAAIGFASLLHRGPMLAGPGDDCLAILLWCLVVGRSGDDLSIDRWLAARAGAGPPAPSPRTRIALTLLLVHAVVITLAALVAQLKGDVWWDGSAAWWLAGREASFLMAPTALRRWEYLMNGITHAVTLFEGVFAVGLCLPATRCRMAWIGVLFWPVIGCLAGEPSWGMTMAVLALAPALASMERGVGCGSWST